MHPKWHGRHTFWWGTNNMGMITSDKLLLELKMSDLINKNYRLLLVLQRLNIGLGFKDLSVEEVCREHGIAPGFFCILVKLYNEGKVLITSPVERRYFPNLVLFLRNSHDYFLKEKIVEIDAAIKDFSASLEHGGHGLLERFWSEYAREVEKHMGYENRQVFPLIISLYEQKSFPLEGLQFIQQFEENHDDIAEALMDLKNLLIKYFPLTEKERNRHRILKDLFELEEDLQLHQQVENFVLIPLVKQLTQENIQL